MPLLGAHMSIKGGPANALFRGKEAGCRVIQLFTRNANRWASKPLSPSEIDAFHRARTETRVEPVSAHDSYLVNLASPRSEIRQKSLEALVEEVKRCDLLGIPYLVMHPGAHLGEGITAGLRRVSDGLNRLFDRLPDSGVGLLLETTAGQGANLGCRFEHLAEIVGATEARERLGVCVDTCHIFAAGYDFRTEAAARALLAKFDEVVGLNRLRLFHLNDAKRELGSRVDRHEHIGRGLIGKEGFTFLLREPIFENTPFLLETPKGRDENGLDWDVRNLRFLNGLVEDAAR